MTPRITVVGSVNLDIVARGPRLPRPGETVTGAVRRDSRLYALLALTDAIRLGQPRERNLAAELLAQMLRDER